MPTCRPAILVVADTPSLRQLACTALANDGFTVLEACGGMEGMSVMLSYGGEIQLAIVEITMPGVNGLDFANQLRVERPKTPVLYIPAVGNSVAADSLRQRNPNSVLRMPFRGEALVKRVRHLLGANKPSTRRA